MVASSNHLYRHSALAVALDVVREMMISVLEEHSGEGNHREWGRMTWLYPGTRIVEIDSDTWAKAIALLATHEGGK